jgi:phosphoglycolate phosphatase
MDSLLKKLNQRHIQICVLSNKPDSDTQSVIKRFFPTIEFAFVYGKKPEFPIKPDPASVLDIIKRLNVPKEAVLYVGDTGTDMATAVNANLEAIGVLWGFRHQEELLTHGANRLISSPEELLTIIETRE